MLGKVRLGKVWLSYNCKYCQKAQTFSQGLLKLTCAHKVFEKRSSLLTIAFLIVLSVDVQFLSTTSSKFRRKVTTAATTTTTTSITTTTTTKVVEEVVVITNENDEESYN